MSGTNRQNTGSATAGDPDPDNPEEPNQPRTVMADVRGLIDEIIAAMITRAIEGKLSDQMVMAAYRAVKFSKKEPLSALRLNKKITYDRLFGFGDNGRLYLPRSEIRVAPLAVIQDTHIGNIKKALVSLKIYHGGPAFDESPASWLPFLRNALAAIEDRPVAPPSEAIPVATNERSEPLSHAISAAPGA